MRERTVDLNSVAWNDDRASADNRPARASFFSRLTHWHAREWLMVLGVVLAVGAVAVNALFLQTGPHPAPMFANRGPSPVASFENSFTLPRPRPTDAKPDQKAEIPMPARTRPEIVADIQRELAQRGFYDGPADGVYGPRTDMAIRDFEHAALLRPSTEPNENLRRSIARSTVKAPPVTLTRDPIANMLSPSKRVVAVQRALADYGYGQIKPTGHYDPQTREAIEQFERSRKLPVTGQITERVTRELASTTGRPLE